MQSYRRVSLAQLQHFACAMPREAALTSSAAFLSSPDHGLRARLGAVAADIPVSLQGSLAIGRLQEGLQRAGEATSQLAHLTDNTQQFGTELGLMHQQLEDDIRSFTFAAKEEFGSRKSQRTELQQLLEGCYWMLLCQRTMVGQHRAVGALQQQEPLGIELVGKQQLGAVCQQAAEDARALSVEKFGVSPEVQVHVEGSPAAVCMAGRIHYMVHALHGAPGRMVHLALCVQY